MEGQRHQHHRHPGPRRLHHRGGARAPRPRRCHPGAVLRGRGTVAVNHGGQADAQVQRPAAVLREQVRQNRRGPVEGAEAGAGQAQAQRRGGSHPDRPGGESRGRRGPRAHGSRDLPRPQRRRHQDRPHPRRNEGARR